MDDYYQQFIGHKFTVVFVGFPKVFKIPQKDLLLPEYFNLKFINSTLLITDLLENFI